MHIYSQSFISLKMKKCQKCKRQNVQKSNVQKPNVQKPNVQKPNVQKPNVQKPLSNDTFEYTDKIVNDLTETELRHEMSFPVNNEKELKKIMDLNKWSLISTNKHVKFQRNVIYKGEVTPRKQTYTRSVSASGRKEYVYILRIMKHQNDNIKYII